MLPEQESENEMHSAVRASDLCRVSFLVATGERIDSLESNGWTPIRVAAARGNGDILRHLLCHFPELEIRDTQMD